MAFIFYLSSLSSPPEVLPITSWVHTDKVYHLAEYAILGFLLARALAHNLPQCFPVSPWAIALLTAALYGASDEWHQSFVAERYPTISDWIVDVLGSTLGVIIVFVHRRNLTRQSTK